MTEKRNIIPGLLEENLPDQNPEQPLRYTPEPGIEPSVEQGIKPVNALSLVQVESTPEIRPAQLQPDSDCIKHKPAERRGLKYLLRDVLSVVISAVIIAAALKAFVIDSRVVPTGSMIPTIQEGDRVIILELPYFLGKTPARQDVVVFSAPEEEEFEKGEDLLKRVIGLPGDTVEVRDGLVFVNGEALDEPYINEQPTYNKLFEGTVPADCYIMLGDNRNRSDDSHLWENPYIPFSDIKGKVILCYWPLSHLGPVE